MATTLIRKKQNNTITNVFFNTYIADIGERDVNVLKVNLVDDSLQPISNCILYEMTNGMDEETYHKELRIKAAEKGDLITSHSTNPEWNPENYSKNLEDCIKNEH